ncbi:MAG TPA: sugar phosphate isomerase/epimerase [Mycobacteriales bacterium]|nr:sugar phosphate isomerase/epimerase [Mycobacteriales bacterium]
MQRIDFSVFTKPWPDLPVDRLGRKLAGLGFDGVELPVRPGFQVEPQDAEQTLPDTVRRLADAGLHTFSVAGEIDEPMFAACAAAAVPMIRIMAPIGPDGYLASEQRMRSRLEAAVPLCERYQIRVGIQQHHGRFVSTSAGLRRLVGGLPTRHICAVWDAGHDALAGEEPDLGLEQVWSYLGMVNLKSAYYRKSSGAWKAHFVDGTSGLARWPDVVAYLVKRSYSGVLCLTAQYSVADALDDLVAGDLRYARSLFY